MTQRTLVIIRHAKSSWVNPLQSDFDRSLNDRGDKDAPMMGDRLKAKKIIPDLIISSTAKRALQTAKKIAKQLGYAESKIKSYDKLYHCISQVFEEVIYEIADDVRTVFIVAHNPGISSFANELSDGFRIDTMPTCGMVGAKLELDDWNEFSKVDKTVFLYDYPKKNI